MTFARSFARRALVVAMVGQAVAAVAGSAPARAATDAFTPVADARVRSDQPAKNFGSATTLVADKSPATESFLRFEVAGLASAPTGARLRLWVTDKSSNGPELRAVTSAWGKPVIYVHGDTHTFTIDHPAVLGTQLPNFTQVEVYGPSDQHWVRVDVDPSSPALFSIHGQ